MPVLALTVLLLFGFGDGRAPVITRSSPTPEPHSTPPALPKPTGRYQVATSVFHLTDPSRPDLLSKQQFRELMFQVWYPAEAAPQAEIARYIPNHALTQALKDTQHDQQDPAVFDGWESVRTGAAMNAPVSRQGSRFPILFLSHGLGEPRSLYTGLSQELASHGYIVVCIDHPYGGITVLPDGRAISTADDPAAGNPEVQPRLVEEWARDASFVLNRMMAPDKTDSGTSGRFAGHIDKSRIGMLGHSLGGAAALEACRADPRFKACADLDGVPFGKVKDEGVKRPTLIMRSGPVYSDEDLAKKGRTRAQWDELGRQVQATWNSLFEKSKGVPIYAVIIKGAGHMSYSDAPFVMPDTINRFGGRTIDAQRGFEIMSAYLRGFFDKYLNHKPSDLLDGPKPPYAEALAESFNSR
ncbi:MAG TPA: hypothetical protein VE961_23815 [Pyrinomonadaceae bacterium]|nr:hypothetical protein [Pyrinomonadaceae bacterium]